MFARFIEAPAKPGKRSEIVNILNHDLMPLLKKQPGFVDFVALASDTEPEMGMTISFWKTKEDAERFWMSREFKTIMERIKPLEENMVVHTCNVALDTYHKIAALKAA